MSGTWQSETVTGVATSWPGPLTVLPSRRLRVRRRNLTRPILAINVPANSNRGLVREWTDMLRRDGVRAVIAVAPTTVQVVPTSTAQAERLYLWEMSR